jgi:hypothetical protein
MPSFLCLKKRLLLAGVFIHFFPNLSAQQNKPWSVFGNPSISSVSVGLALDSSYVYVTNALLDFPYDYYVYKVDRESGVRDSLRILNVDSTIFRSFYIESRDSSIFLLGAVINENESDFQRQRRTGIVHISKDLTFVDSTIFGDQGYLTDRYSASKDKYFITEQIPFASGLFLSVVDKNTLNRDTAIPIVNNPGLDYDFSVAYDSSAKKIICISTVAATYIFNATNYNLDSSFWNWDTTYATIPAIEDMFFWNGGLYSLAKTTGLSLYKHDVSNYRINARTALTLDDTLTQNGGYVYIRGNYGFSNGLLVLAEAGPFTAIPPLQTNTVTNVRAYAADTSSNLIWTTQINNGRNNLVHSTACDDSNTFILVRSISVDQPAEPQKMLLYKLDAHGNAFDLNTPEVVKKIGVHVYPNPVKDWVVFETALLNNKKELVLTLLNAQGQIVHQAPLPPGRYRLDLSSFRSGVISYQITKQGMVQKTGKIIVQ